MPTQTYVFRATGQGKVVKAYESIAKAAGRADGAVARSARATQSVEDKRERAYERSVQAAQAASRKRRSIEDRELDALSRRYEKELREYEKMERKKRAIAERESRARARLREKGLSQIGGAVRNVGGAMYGIGRTGVLAGVAGAAMVAQAGARDQMALEGMASRMALNAKLAGGTANVGQLTKSLRSAAVAVPGVKAQDLAKASLEYQGRTGDLLSEEQLKTIGKVSMFSGATPEDLGSIAGALKNHMGITNNDDMYKALLTQAEQGATGEFELKDIASLYNRIGAAAGGISFGKGTESVKKLGGMLQMIRQNTGSPEQAVTGTEAMFRQMIANSSKLEKKYKVNAFTDDSKTQLRDPMDIMRDFLSASGGSTVALQEIFGEEGKRGAMGFAKQFLQGYNETDGTDEEKTAAGLKALDDALAKATQTTMTTAAADNLAAEASQTTAAKMTAAWEGFMQKAEPAFIKMLEAAGKFAEGLGGIMEQLAPDKRGTQDKLRDAEKKADEAGDKLAAIMLDPNSSKEQVDAAKREFDIADAEVGVAKLNAWEPGAVTAFRSKTGDQVAKDIAAAGGGGFFQEMIANDAVNLAENNGGGIFDNIRGAITRQFLSGEQEELMNQYGAQKVAEKAGVDGGGGDMASITQNLSAFTEALAQHQAKIVEAQGAVEKLKGSATRAGDALEQVGSGAQKAATFQMVP